MSCRYRFSVRSTLLSYPLHCYVLNYFFFPAPPPALVNVSVHPTAVLALLLWEVGEDTGGYEILHFSAQYRLKYDEAEGWHDVLPKQIDATAVS